MAFHLAHFYSLSSYGLDGIKNTSKLRNSVVLFYFQGTPVEPGAGGPPTYGTDSAAPPTYDEATGWSL